MTFITTPHSVHVKPSAATLNVSVEAKEPVHVPPCARSRVSSVPVLLIL